mgnify:CR=1 FL=1
MVDAPIDDYYTNAVNWKPQSAVHCRNGTQTRQASKVREREREVLP